MTSLEDAEVRLTRPAIADREQASHAMTGRSADSCDEIQTAIAKQLIFPDQRTAPGERQLLDAELSAKVARFAGFIGSVRHAQCRSSLPGTFRVLKDQGLFYRFFEYYEPIYQAARLQKRANSCEQLDAFIVALEAFVHAGTASKAHAALSNMLAHERTVLSLKNHHAQGEESAKATPGKPRWNGDVVVRQIPFWFAADYLKLAEAVADAQGNTHVLYHRGMGSDMVCISACDEESAAIIALVDGSLTAPEGVLRVEDSLENELIASAIAELSAAGLIVNASE